MTPQHQTLIVLGCIVFAIWFLWFLHERSWKIAKIHDLRNELDIDYRAEKYKWFFVARHARLRKEYLLKAKAEGSPILGDKDEIKPHCEDIY